MFVELWIAYELIVVLSEWFICDIMYWFTWFTSATIKLNNIY